MQAEKEEEGTSTPLITWPTPTLKLKGLLSVRVDQNYGK
jgi:hypothetical protein